MCRNCQNRIKTFTKSVIITFSTNAEYAHLSPNLYRIIFLKKYGIRINRYVPHFGMGNLKVPKFDAVLVNQEKIDIEKEITQRKILWNTTRFFYCPDKKNFFDFLYNPIFTYISAVPPNKVQYVEKFQTYMNYFQCTKMLSIKLSTFTRLF